MKKFSLGKRNYNFVRLFQSNSYFKLNFVEQGFSELSKLSVNAFTSILTI